MPILPVEKSIQNSYFWDQMKAQETLSELGLPRPMERSHRVPSLEEEK